MDRKETAKVLAVIQEIFPHFMDGRAPDTTTEIWQRMFASDEYNRVEAAVLAYIASETKGFAPSIGQIKEKIAQMDADNELDEAGAWALVATAMKNGIYGADKEFKKLPPEVQRAVGTADQLRDWSMMDIETVNSVVSSNFMRNYRARAGYIRDMKKLPEAQQQFFKLAGDAFSMDRAYLTAAEAPEEAPAEEPAEDIPMPDAVKAIMSDVKKKMEQDRADEAHRQVKMLMRQLLGIEIPSDQGGGANGK